MARLKGIMAVTPALALVLFVLVARRVICGGYSRPRPSAAVIAQCAPYRFAPITTVAAEAASEEDGTLTR